MEQLNCTVNTNSSTPSFVSWDFSHLVPAVILSICFALGVPGNLAVIILKPNYHHMSSLSQSLMLNLAISDLLCLLTLPFWIHPLLYDWPFGLVTCKVLAYVLHCSMYGSMLTITVLSVQRCLQVVYLQKCLDQVGKKRILILLWLVVMTLYSPILLLRQLTKDQHCGTSCRPQYSSQAQWMVVLLTESLMGFGSFSVVTFSYICLHRKVNQAAFFNNPQTTRLVASIIVAFFVLWIPYHTIHVMIVLAVSLKNEGLIKFCQDSWNIVEALTAVNSCLNPVLYTFTLRNMCSGQNSENKYCC
ncbi:leukotriene B4 receptor 1-like [Scomber japonicus]|uniref:leukotriene B4 receptor 1-like n=1 Tax=Scomber japonicus TaxID=13676 RepID=UPI002305DDC3|nr:leukotriene B4 receptor 1-like [Scomber japonicus]